LPFETSIYVAKITAMAIVANNPERFGFADLTREPTVELAEIDVPQGTPLRPVAASAGLDVDALKALNPHLKKNRVPPGTEPVHVYIPRASYERFAERWSRNHEPAQTVSYVLRFGETLEDVARRYRMPPARLREMNELDEGTIVAAGFPIVVPAVGEVPTLNGEKRVATVPDKDFHYENRRRIFYRVARNDTPEAVARFFDVTVDELVAWNNITEHGFLQRDMLLQLFVRPELDIGRAVVLTPDQVHILTVGSDEFFDFHEGQRGRVRVRYRVQPKDTLAKIAERFELSVGSLGRINQFASNKELKADDWIIVYVPEKSLPELERKGIAARVSAPKADTKLAATPAAEPEPEAQAQPDASEPGLPPEEVAENEADDDLEGAAPGDKPSEVADVTNEKSTAASEEDDAGEDSHEAREPTPAATPPGAKSAP
jgi:membrane-bound lytic murein transglycosylase D